MNAAAELIRLLELERHPEGGWYRETYRSTELIPHQGLPERFDGPRCFCTTILFLLEQGEMSALHRIRSDEIWHFHAGSSLTVHVIAPDGEYRELRLGSELSRGESFQAVVPAGCWFGAEVSDQGAYALVGCTVSPGFDFQDFEMGERETLQKAFPAHAELVRRMTGKREV